MSNLSHILLKHTTGRGWAPYKVSATGGEIPALPLIYIWRRAILKLWARAHFPGVAIKIQKRSEAPND